MAAVIRPSGVGYSFRKLAPPQIAITLVTSGRVELIAGGTGMELLTDGVAY